MRISYDYEKNKRAAERFRRMTDETSQHLEGMPQPCWLWQGTFDSKGYPRFKMNGVSMNAKRVATFFNGWNPEPCFHVVCLCQDRRCVHPHHNPIGSPKDALLFGRGYKFYRRTIKYGIGDQLNARQIFKEGNLTPEELAEAWEITPRIARAVLMVREPRPSERK